MPVLFVVEMVFVRAGWRKTSDPWVLLRMFYFCYDFFRFSVLAGEGVCASRSPCDIEFFLGGGFSVWQGERANLGGRGVIWACLGFSDLCMFPRGYLWIRRVSKSLACFSDLG